MKSLFVLCACLLAACSTQAVRCGRHLTPINTLQRPIAALHAAGRPDKTNAASSVALRQSAPSTESSP